MLTINLRMCMGIAFLLIALSSIFADARCLDTDKMKEDWEKCKHDFKSKWIDSVQKKCAEDNQEKNEETNKKCAEDKISAAEKKCTDQNQQVHSHTKMMQCLKDELGMEAAKHHWTYEQFEEKFLTYVIDAEKIVPIKNIVRECKDVDDTMKRWMCGLTKLGDGLCPELKTYMEEAKKQWANLTDGNDT